MDKKLERFEMRTTTEFLELVDDVRRQHKDLPSRAEMIRIMVEMSAMIAEPEFLTKIDKWRKNRQTADSRMMAVAHLMNAGLQKAAEESRGQ